MSIDHAAEAVKLVARHIEFSDADTSEVSTDIAALTHATLALVEQQRIANLLAIACADVGEVPLAFRDLARRGLVKAGREGNPRDDIREGLGL